MLHARPDYNLIQDPRGRIPEKEPVFLLRGQDPKIQPCIRLWIELARKDGSDPACIAALERHLVLCDEWQAKIKTKTQSDMPAELPDDTPKAVQQHQVWKNMDMRQRGRPYVLIQTIMPQGVVCFVCDEMGKFPRGVQQVVIPLAQFNGRAFKLHLEAP